MNTAPDLLCVEVFHVYLDPATAEARIAGQIGPTATALEGLLSSRAPGSWRPLVVIDDYFVIDRSLRDEEAGARDEIRELELAAIRKITGAWEICWQMLQRTGREAFAHAAPAPVFVRESAFEPLARSLAEMLVPRLRKGNSASTELDGSGWRRPPWTAGPEGAWLANGRPPRSAPARRGELQQLHATLDRTARDKHSIHLDVELFDCDQCRLGGRCDGFGRCQATVTRSRDLRMSCPLLAAALHAGRQAAGGAYPHEPVPTVAIDGGAVRETGALEPAGSAVSVLDARFLEVEHAVGVILDHLLHPVPKPGYVFISPRGPASAS